MEIFSRVAAEGRWVEVCAGQDLGELLFLQLPAPRPADRKQSTEDHSVVRGVRCIVWCRVQGCYITWAGEIQLPATPGCCCMLEYEQLLSSIRLPCWRWWCHLLCRIIATSWPQQLPAVVITGDSAAKLNCRPRRWPHQQAFTAQGHKLYFINCFCKKLYLNIKVLGC